ILIQDGEFEQAERAIAVLDEDTTNKIFVIQETSKLARARGDSVGSIKILEGAINAGIQSEGILEYDVGALIRKYNNDLSRSIKYFSIAFSINPVHSNLRENLAVCLVDYADEIAETDSDTAQAYREQALQILSGSSESTMRTHKKMIDFLINATASSGFQRKYRGTVVPVRSSEGQKPKYSFDVAYNTSYVQERAAYIAKNYTNGDLSALRYLVNTIKDDDVRPPVLLETAASYALRIGYYDLACDLTQQALDVSPERSQSLHLKAIALLRSGKDKEAYETAEKLHKAAPKNKDGALMYAIGLATQERYPEMLAVTRPFIDRIRSGDVVPEAFHEFIALQTASLCEPDKTEELVSNFTDSALLLDKIKRLSDAFRAQLNAQYNVFKRPDVTPIPAWEQKLARAYKTSSFWDLGFFVPVDRVASRVAYKPHNMPK
ncbi:MAG: hypothetical protein AAGB32_03665, partial [Pseudomonadota bacterium]